MEKESEFLRRYSVDDETTWYLAEYATLPVFRFFCDIDQKDTQSDETIDFLFVASSLSAILTQLWEGSRRSPVIIVGRVEEQNIQTGEYQLGCHLHCPTTIVSQDEALKIRAHLITELEKDGRKDWDKIVDPTVYEHMTLRLLGCSKLGPRERVYDLIGVIEEDGRPDYNRECQYKCDRLKLVTDCSVRTKIH